MDTTIQITRDQETEKAFVKHMQRLKEKYPYIQNWLSWEARTELATEGVRLYDHMNGIMGMEVTHPYPGTKGHHIFYPKNDNAEVNGGVEGLFNAALAYFRHKYKDNPSFLILKKTEGTFDTPHVHLLVY
jgi:hypothetical protein